MTLGDSRTQADPWRSILTEAISAADGWAWTSYDGGRDYGTVYVTGGSAVQMSDPARLASIMGAAFPPGAAVREVAVNLGVNDAYYGLPTQVQFETAYLYIVDQLNARWPYARIWIMSGVWRRDVADATLDTVSGWIQNVIAARPGVCFSGPDERVWLENGDDGVTYTTDGVHYNAAGNARLAELWLAAMGY